VAKDPASELEGLRAGAGIRQQLEFDGRMVPALVVNYRGQVHAYRNRCPHRGTELDWQPGEFFDEHKTHLVCATHGALFQVDTGKCVSGPCVGQSLTRLDINAPRAESPDPGKN